MHVFIDMRVPAPLYYAFAMLMSSLEIIVSSPHPVIILVVGKKETKKAKLKQKGKEKKKTPTCLLHTTLVAFLTLRLIFIHCPVIEPRMVCDLSDLGSLFWEPGTACSDQSP